jgi:hypothetical protein
MKKLFFTAIALVAFSGISMAKTITDLDVSNKTNSFSNEKLLIISDYWGCSAVASQVYDELMEIDPYGAMIEANEAFDDCMGISNTPCRPPFIC